MAGMPKEMIMPPILLSTGNETDRAEAYRKFRGRDPDATALL
jgi:peptidyl-dipeptidase Dcp